MCGGNTFTLLKLIKEYKFDKQLIEYIKKGVIYIGRSAGTHLMTKNIKHVLSFDDNYIGLEEFDGLGIFDGIVFCHYSDERKKYYEEAILDGKYNVYKITNDEMIVIDEEKFVIV